MIKIVNLDAKPEAGVRLGRDTHSVTNFMMGNSKMPKPEVGMGATILMATDRRAATIIWVSESGRQVIIQEDKAIRVDSNGMSESQEYRYERDEDSTPVKYSLRKDGAWRQVGQSQGGLLIGRRSEYYDYSF